METKKKVYIIFLTDLLLMAASPAPAVATVVAAGRPGLDLDGLHQLHLLLLHLVHLLHHSGAAQSGLLRTL